jgi:hypothetical protein
MAYIFLGLGNPGEDYKNTRHNTGRIVLEFFAKEFGFSEFVFDKKINALKSEGKIGKEKVFLVFPETFMNNSGKTVKALGLSVKQVEKLLVVYDDLDLPFLKTKLSYTTKSFSTCLTDKPNAFTVLPELFINVSGNTKKTFSFPILPSDFKAFIFLSKTNSEKPNSFAKNSNTILPVLCLVFL